MSEILANAASTLSPETNLAALLGSDTAAIVASKYGDDKAFAGVSSGSFLPRVQLCGSNSGLCKKNKIGQGRYAVTNAKDVVLHDLSESFACLVLSWRPKAMRFAGSDTKAYYNPKSPFFTEIRGEADERVQGSQYGPEYLLYLPEQKVFATMFFMNPTMRREAPNMQGQLNKIALVGCKLIEMRKGNKEYSWHGPVITACSTPIALPTGDELADFQAQMRSHRDRFNAPPEEDIEETQVDDQGEPARER